MGLIDRFRQAAMLPFQLVTRQASDTGGVRAHAVGGVALTSLQLKLVSLADGMVLGRRGIHPVFATA